MLPVKFRWGSVLLRGDLQKYAKNSNFENFQSALYSTSVSMPLSIAVNGAHAKMADLRRWATVNTMHHVKFNC